MLLRFFTTSVLFLFLATIVAAQGTAVDRQPLLVGFVPLSEQQLQQGYIRPFDNTGTFGWTGNQATIGIRNGELHFNGALADSPFYFLGFDAVPQRVFSGTDAVRPEGLTTIFDGETLAGWSIVGSIDVTVEDGAIFITSTSGVSGALEYEGLFGDFVLQLEFYTPVRSGSSVNSGVFFRSIPGENMNGYECQIQNTARQSGATLGTRTGGIFRFQDARYVGARDGEWNHLTIAARGPRMASWVNGIQVTDWTDEREPHNNPRNGSRLEAGTIQFQGHGSGTEIRFRNIRIKEL